MPVFNTQPAQDYPLSKYKEARRYPSITELGVPFDQTERALCSLVARH